MKIASLLILFFISFMSLSHSQTKKNHPWKGNAILGNGNITVVYSDDPGITAITKAKGIQHLYYKDYTVDYVASSVFNLPDQNGNQIESVEDSIGMENFFTPFTISRLKDKTIKKIKCFVHPKDAFIIDLSFEGASNNSDFQFDLFSKKEFHIG